MEQGINHPPVSDLYHKVSFVEISPAQSPPPPPSFPPVGPNFRTLQSEDAVEALLAAVAHMRVSDYLRKLLGLLPTSPKPGREGGGLCVIRRDIRWCLSR